MIQGNRMTGFGIDHLAFQRYTVRIDAAFGDSPIDAQFTAALLVRAAYNTR